MRRISLAMALLGAIAGSGCSGGSNPSSSGSSKGVPGSTYTVAVRGDGTSDAVTGGRVTSGDGAIDCGVGAATQKCSADFAWGTTVVLTAAPDTANGYKYFGFAGSCSGTGTCTLSGNADKTVLVRFFVNQWGHPNFSSPAIHAPEYAKFVAGNADAYKCTDCHGANLQGQGLALSCNTCHQGFAAAPPPPPPPAVTVPATGIAGVVSDRSGYPVEGAVVYAIPTGDVPQEPILTPKHYDSTATYTANVSLVSYHEVVYRAKAAAAAPQPVTATVSAAGLTDDNWEFIALTHTPHAYSSSVAYKAGDLVRYNTAAPITTYVFQAAQDTTAGSAPPTTATSNTDWNYVGTMGKAATPYLAFWDDMPAWAKQKSYPTGAIIRDSNSVYRALTGGRSGTVDRASDTNVTWQSLSSLIALARDSETDEPLEDLIRTKGDTYARSTATGADGVFTIDPLPAGGTDRFYVTVMFPDGSAYLPGGDKCRIALPSANILGTQLNVRVASNPSAGAAYIGPSACLNCHDKHNTNKTAHSLGIRAASGERATKTPDYSRFADWKRPLEQYFTEVPTVLFVKGKGIGGDVAVNTTTREQTPTSHGTADFVAHLYTASGKYYVMLEKSLGGVKWKGQPTTGPDGVFGTGDDVYPNDGVYEVELTYGGAVYKQRFITKIGDQRHLLPLQFNYEAPGNWNEAVPAGRQSWAAYNSRKWGARTSDDSATGTEAMMKNPGVADSFDRACAGCHFTGYNYDSATTKAHGVRDANGEYDYDGDTYFESINLSCESCHGPGSEHRANARAGMATAIVNPALLTPERELTICSQCHTRVRGFYNDDTPVKVVAGVSTMPRPGISRKQFLDEYVVKVDEGMWDSKSGNGKYSKSHHQQASDFLMTTKYRNSGVHISGMSLTGRPGYTSGVSASLQTCSSCHDLHGDSGLPRQLRVALDTKTGSATSDGLCRQCHGKTLISGHVTRGSANPTHGAAVTETDGMTCASCHVPKTSKSGSGAAAANIGGEQFYRGDISSHLFIGVPYVYYTEPSKLSEDVKEKFVNGTSYDIASGDVMPIPYTNACGNCHTQERSLWKNGSF